MLLYGTKEGLTFAIYNSKSQEKLLNVEDGNFILKIVDQRTYSQNALLHRWIAEIAMAITNASGQYYTPSVMKHMLKYRLRPDLCVDFKHPDGKEDIITFSTRTMSKKDFSAFMDLIEGYAIEKGIILSDKFFKG